MKLVLTRPEAEAGAWAQALSSAGHEVLRLPLLAFGPAPHPKALASAWLAAQSFHAAMFVSSQAVRSFFAARPPQLLWSGRCWATGPGTQAALRQAGVDASLIDVPAADAAQLDSEALWAVVSNQVLNWHEAQPCSVLLVRGSDADSDSTPDVQGQGRDWLSQQLQSAGVNLSWVVAYQRLAPTWSAREMDFAFRATSDGSVWLFSSSQAWLQLKRLMPGPHWAQARALATHGRIASALKLDAWGRVDTCKGALAAVLQALHPDDHWR